MQEFGSTMLLALIPAAGVLLGAALGEFTTVTRKTRSYSLHAAAGIVLAVVAVELMPEALAAEPPWIPIVAFAAGGLLFVLIDRSVDLVAAAGEETPRRGAWMIFLAVVMDLLTDGIMVGSGSTVRFSLAALLAVAQIPGNVPEGYATIAAMKESGVPRMRRLLAFAALTVVVTGGAAAGYWFLQDRPLIYRMGTLAFTAGILTTIVVEEIVPESHQKKEARAAVLYFIGGFVSFMAVASYVD